jgi:hypothetical protein
MYLRNGFYVLLSSLFLTGLISCLGGSDEGEYIVSDDALMTSFSIAHDSIPILAKTPFSIDQTKSEGEIYNHDSLPYLTDIFERVKVTYTTGSGVSGLMTVVEGDTVWVASGDSLDVSKPVQFTLFAPSGKKKEYRLTVSIHQIDPDSAQYVPIASNDFLLSDEYKMVQLKGVYYAFTKSPAGISLYKSTDMISWESLTLNGLPGNVLVKEIQADEIKLNETNTITRLYAYTAAGELYVSFDDNVANWNKIEIPYPVVSVFGYLNSSKIQEDGLAFIVKKDDTSVFAFSDNFLDFQLGETVPEDFPVSGFSVIHNKSSLGLERITLVGGKSSSGKNLNTVWTTENGLYWANLSSNPQGNLPQIEGGSAFAYNDEIWFVGGKIADGDYNKDVYYSVDGGLVWKTKETKAQVPAEFSLREYASVVVDNRGIYFYIAGGKNQNANTPALTDIWRGMLNSRTFVP